MSISLWDRALSAWNGARMGWGMYDSRVLIPSREQPYGDYAARLVRYDTALAYYYNTIYDSLNVLSSRIKHDERLYKFIRGIQNPVRQENNLLVSYTYRGTIDQQTLTGGSMPLVFDNTQLEDPLKSIIKWSNLDQQLSPYVRDAALLGDTAWWIVDDPFRKRVRLELVDPARIKYVERDEVGNIRAAVIEYECDEEPDVERYRPTLAGMTLQKTKTYVKTIKITREWFETFKDGEPFAYATDANGNPVARWPNIYGFVPLKMAYYTQGKDGWGQNSFFGTVRRQIDEVNDQASIINDSVRNVVMPLLQALKTRSADEITISRTDKDSVSIAYMSGDGAELKPVTIPLDIAGASGNFDRLVAGLERNLPILALQRIRDIGGNLSGVAIQNMFGDATSCIENLRKNLNPPLVAALQMALTVGGIRRYDGFAGINENSFDAGDLELSIGTTPVIDDRLSVSEHLDKLISIAPLPVGTKREALVKMGYTEKVADEIISDDQAEAEEKQRAAVRAFADSTFADDDEDIDDDEPDTEAPEADEEAEDARTPVAA